jgi:tRNA(fMet)-specific endonuclease VapC
MIFLDTSALVSILRKQPEGARIKDMVVNESIAITSISAFELFYGARLSTKAKENIKTVKELLEEYPVFDLTYGSAFIASSIQVDLRNEGLPIELNDVYIAAIVLENDGSLVTLNKDHFNRVKNLKLLPMWVKKVKIEG